MEKVPRVLIVDDEEANLTLIETILKPQGYHIDMASSGEAAIEIIARNQPDVILLDISMPGMDGYETAQAIKGNPGTHVIPIIMVTGYNTVQDRIRGIESGADDFLSKPVDVTELRARVKSLIKVRAYHEYMISHQKSLEREVAARTEELQKSYEKIRVASLETIHRLSRAAEYRDDDTGSHINRMSRYSTALARRFGLVEKNVDNILYASPMHDTGKIGVPDSILLKPGKLTPEEWEIMKQHTTIGGKILEGSASSIIQLAEIIALSHHEKWDGSGYPKGLQEKDIPLSGRIVALADVFDALSSKRPYKEPFPNDKVLAIIKEGQGQHFDPELVDCFLDIIDEVMAIKEEFSE